MNSHYINYNIDLLNKKIVSVVSKLNRNVDL